MTVSELLAAIAEKPQTLEFKALMDGIAAHYEFTPTRFTNGDLVNAPDQNQGSCKVFSFAKLHSLTDAQTLACFGAYYREDVLQNPHGDDHQNIRNFMKTGMDGVSLEGRALKPI